MGSEKLQKRMREGLRSSLVEWSIRSSKVTLSVMATAITPSTGQSPPHIIVNSLDRTPHYYTPTAVFLFLSFLGKWKASMFISLIGITHNLKERQGTHITYTGNDSWLSWFCLFCFHIVATVQELWCETLKSI